MSLVTSTAIESVYKFLSNLKEDTVVDLFFFLGQPGSVLINHMFLIA